MKTIYPLPDLWITWNCAEDAFYGQWFHNGESLMLDTGDYRLEPAQ